MKWRIVQKIEAYEDELEEAQLAAEMAANPEDLRSQKLHSLGADESGNGRTARYAPDRHRSAKSCVKKAADSRPTYRIEVARLARKQLLRLPDKARTAIQAAIDALETDPRPSGVKKLKGSEEYRIRVGDYRIAYSIFDNILLVEVVKVGQRGKFYDE